jgi:GxxExxY protein
MEHQELTSKIIACAYKVHNTLGAGFLEKVYENALKLELIKQGLTAIQQVPIQVYYDEVLVGDFYADIFVNDTVIIEIKAVENLNPIHEVQLVNYLKATNTEVGLLINFGSSVEIKRKYRTYKSTKP